MENINKPKELYRGRKYDSEEIIVDDFKFSGGDLTPPLASYNDKKQKIVSDGNEYGLYMSDNKLMVYGVYGDVHNMGKPIDSSITIGMERFPLAIPSIGVVYVIDTTGIDIRKPWVTEVLEGVYNNGYGGDEWITEKVPAENYVVSRVTIGADYLHEKVQFDFLKADETENVKEKTRERIKRLNKFFNILKTIPEPKRRMFSSQEQELFRYLFGENGIVYQQDENTDMATGCIDSLIKQFALDDDGNFNLTDCRYLYKIKKLCDKVGIETKEEVRELIVAEMGKSNQYEQKAKFIKRIDSMKQSAEKSGFDN